MGQPRPGAAGARSPGDGPVVVTVGSAALVGGRGQPVMVEARVVPGAVGGFAVVGYRVDAFRELRDRVRAAFITSGLSWPNGAITVTTSPLVGRSRDRVVLDLPIAMALLAADGQIPADRVTGRVFLGELGLDGTIRPVKQALELVGTLRGAEVVVPVESLPEARAAAALVGDVAIRTSYNLTTLLAVLDADRSPPGPGRASAAGATRHAPSGRAGARFLSDVDGTIYESLGDGRYAVIDGPHGVPSQLPLGTVVNAGDLLDTWTPLGNALADRPSDQGSVAHLPAHRAAPAGPYLRRMGEGDAPAGWAIDPAGRWGDRDTEVVYDPRRHEVAFTWQTKSAGGSAAVLEATGWVRRVADGPRAFWTRDRLAATRAALDRHDRAVGVGAEIGDQAATAVSADAHEVPGP